MSLGSGAGTGPPSRLGAGCSSIRIERRGPRDAQRLGHGGDVAAVPEVPRRLVRRGDEVAARRGVRRTPTSSIGAVGRRPAGGRAATVSATKPRSTRIGAVGGRSPPRQAEIRRAAGLAVAQADRARRRARSRGPGRSTVTRVKSTSRPVGERVAAPAPSGCGRRGLQGGDVGQQVLLPVQPLQLPDAQADQDGQAMAAGDGRGRPGSAADRPARLASDVAMARLRRPCW